MVEILKYKANIKNSDIEIIGYISEVREYLGDGCFGQGVDYVLTVTEKSMPGGHYGSFKVEPNSISEFSQDAYLESKIKQASRTWEGVDVEAYVNEVRGGEPKQPELNHTDAKILATNIYTDHYIALFDSETDKGEEVTVSILAAQCALITIRHMIEVDPKSQFLRLVESEIETINN